MRKDNDRPEAYAQTATPRVSTWTTWAREKKPGKVVEGFPGPQSPLSQDLGGLSLSRARNTSSEERRGRDQRDTERSRVVWRLDSTPIGLCEISRETCDVPPRLRPADGV